MRRRIGILLLAVVLTAGFAGHALASLLYNQNVTPDIIFGSGNANGAFTVDRSSGVELGLRGKLRYNETGLPENTFNSNGDGTYTFDAGVAPTQSFPTAVWSFEWSINTDYAGSTGWDLNDLKYTLALDSDPTAGTNFLVFDPINDPGPSGAVFWDHSIGTNDTANGAGLVASTAEEYASLIADNNVAQQSWKPHWFLPSFDPNLDATYDLYLAAFDGTTQVARTEIQIIVGNGAAPVPEPTTLLLLTTSLIGLAGVRRKTKK